MTQTAKAKTGLYVEISLDKIDESKTNPRRAFGDLDDLAKSIGASGVLQPVLVRTKTGKRFELVFGSRRYRAAKLAKLTTIPARVCQMSDLEVLEAQIVENNQRSDVHPLEEADAYQTLVKDHNKSVDEIAAKIGRSTAHVYQRLKLSALHLSARALFLAGKLNPATALLVARIPNEKLQAQVAKEITQGGYDEQPMTAAEAAQHIRERYMLRLSAAPFDVRTDNLIPGVGPCAACPKRTGNQTELFGDIKGADLCTDPTCHQKKAVAGWKAMQVEAKEKGIRVLGEAETKKLFPHRGSSYMNSSEFVNLADANYSDPKSRTWGQIVGKDPKDLTLARTPDGKIIKLVPRGIAAAAARKLAPKSRALSDGGYVPPSPLDRAINELKVKHERKVEQLARAATVARIEGAGVGNAQWRWMIERQIEDDYEGQVAGRRLPDAEGDKAQDQLIAQTSKMTANQLVGLFVELWLIHMGMAADASELAKIFGVDLKKVTASAKKELDAAIAEERAKAKAKTAKAKKK